LFAFTASLMCTCASATAALPDNRDYELVSPAAKNGSDVMAATSKTIAAQAGGAVAFASLRGFGDVRGTSTDAQYLARRTGIQGTSGWDTHAVTPAGRSHTPAALATFNWSSFEAAFTPDLSRAVYRSWRPLTDPANTDDLLNLFVISNLLTGPGSAELATDSEVAIPALDPIFKLFFMQPSLDAVSTDLSHVLFESSAALTPEADANPFAQKLYEYAGGRVRLVGRVPTAPDTECDDINGPACVAASSSQAGISGSVGSEAFYADGMMSDDGSRAFFQVPAGGGPGAVYMRENGTMSVQLNVNETTGETPAARLWAAAADGSRVFFASSDSLIDGGEGGLYMYDANAPAGSHLTLLSRSEIGESHSFESVIGTSDDGHYVYFASSGQLVGGESARPTAGLYLWHDGDLAYIGDFVDGSEARRNGPRTSWNFPKVTRMARVAPDGRHVLFMTRSDAGFAGRGGFTGYDQNGVCPYDPTSFGCRELYVYSADTGRLACASCNPTGRTATSVALTDLTEGSGSAWITAHLSRALSDDGSRVFFSTAEALVPGDTNRTWDAYEYDVPSASVHLLSSGRDPTPSYFMDASANGDDVFFVTRQQLVGWDVDDSYDLYDARVNGGLPDPVKPPPVCAGDACLPAAGGQPATDTAGSGQYHGLGNAPGKLRKHKRCARGRVHRTIRGRQRCVRAKKHKRARHRRR